MSGSSHPDLTDANSMKLSDVQTKLANDPNNANYLKVQSECEAYITLLRESIGEPEKPEVRPEPQPEPKWSRENHPAFKAKAGNTAATKVSDESSSNNVNYQVGQKIEAKWEDKKFYHATIISSSGSMSKPQFVVKFHIDNSTQTVTNLSDIRPLADRKRKADDVLVPPPPPPSKPGVISAPANIDQNLANQARQEPSKVSDGPMRPAKAPKKLEKTKELNKRQTGWQAFVGKQGKVKESQFRTPDRPNARGQSTLFVNPKHQFTNLSL